ncbi:AraC family transcriptional regulator [Aestuariispira ectoiniformans]|uniref:AraC family transcriptional regulator n=1 Tax=Aestuariispira ectoiniformans TaxID=2775080 RepID=UPI00223BC01B|nr:AraC family transcriptional regulator [Aestuariispira ectoiniformans]
MTSFEKFRDQLLDVADEDGVFKTPLSRVGVYRTSKKAACHQCLYEPALVFVAQGEKCCHLNGESYTYTPENYFVTSVPMPVQAEVLKASEEHPLVATILLLDLAELGELILELDEEDLPPQPQERGIYTSAVQERQLDAFVRLFEAMKSEQEARILGPQICREIVYLTLTDPKGGGLKAMARRHNASIRIARVLKVIHEDPKCPLDVPQMAAMAQMSQSGFFAAFKALTSMSPVQYQKSIRLHQARNLILNEGLLVSDAAYRVGYSTASQFSRDYARFFDKTARQDLAETQAQAVAL